MTDIVESLVAGVVRIDIATLVAQGVKTIEVRSLPTSQFSLEPLSADARSPVQIAEAVHHAMQQHHSRIR